MKLYIFLAEIIQIYQFISRTTNKKQHLFLISLISSTVSKTQVPESLKTTAFQEMRLKLDIEKKLSV